jgi:hypothetical protein
MVCSLPVSLCLSLSGWTGSVPFIHAHCSGTWKIYLHVLRVTLAGTKAVSRWVCEIRWGKRFIPLFSPNCCNLHKIQPYRLLIFTKRRKTSGSGELWCYVLNEFSQEKEEEQYNNNNYSLSWAVGQKWSLVKGIGKTGVCLSPGESNHWSLGWLPWLPLKLRIRFNMLVLTFKSFQISRGRFCFAFSSLPSFMFRWKLT